MTNSQWVHDLLKKKVDKKKTWKLNSIPLWICIRFYLVGHHLMNMVAVSRFSVLWMNVDGWGVSIVGYRVKHL